LRNDLLKWILNKDGQAVCTISLYTVFWNNFDDFWVIIVFTQQTCTVFAARMYNKTVALHVNHFDSVLHLKTLMNKKFRLPTKDMQLVLGPKQLDDIHSIGFYHVQNESTLDVAIRLRGGACNHYFVMNQGKTFCLPMQYCSVEEKIYFVWDLLGFKPDTDFIIYSAKQLEDGDTEVTNLYGDKRVKPVNVMG
jgi:hypothetical protein